MMLFYPNNTSTMIRVMYAATIFVFFGFAYAVYLYVSILSEGGRPGIALLLLMGASCIYTVPAGFGFRNDGICLVDNEYYSRKYKMKRLCCSDIGAILIVPKKYGSRGYWDGIPRRMVEIEGKKVKVPVYAMILLQETGKADDYPAHLGGSSALYESEYRKSILGAALYNEELLYGLLQRNPNIRVLASEPFLLWTTHL